MTVTALEYAKMIDYSPSMVSRKIKAMNDNIKLPGVSSVKKIGTTYILTLRNSFNKDAVRKEFKNISIKDLVNSN